ncbi:MAG TPA: phage tail sheath C-terminal domain-containing protein [Gaiellaceae bacterium]|nr:phage tail sheath C-terminal domain-containing protein [Gaiellaceae bacterium]
MSRPPRIDGVATSTTGLVGRALRGPADEPVLVTSLAEYERVFGGPQAGHDLLVGAQLYFGNGGRRAWAVRPGGQSRAAIRQALAALDTVDDLGLLCLPGLSGGQTLAAAAAYARSRRAFLVAEPAGTKAATVAAAGAIAAAARGHAAIWFPRLEVPDPLQPAARVRFGSSAAIAGLLARTDLERGVWAFPAGALRRTTGPASAIDAHGAALLRRDGVNAIRRVQGQGIVPWGVRTVGRGRDSDEEWRYVPVRRTALYLEESIDRGLAWAAFEPNDEPTWTRIRATVAAFLEETFQTGAFAGRTPEESYFVRCGLETTTQREIENGVVVVEVGFAPLRPAEFVAFRIRHRLA